MAHPAALPDDHATELVLDALGNPIRRQILRMIEHGALSVGEIAERFDISRPAVSRHLSLLEHAGLLTHRGHGTRNLYRLDTRGMEHLRSFLASFWDEAEARLKLVAGNLGADDD